MEKVCILSCESYDYELVEKKIFECLDSIENIKPKVRTGSKVLVKANLLKKNSPDDAVTTHPTVVEAIVRYFQQLGCKVIVGDSPGGPFNEKSLMAVYKATGMFDVQKRTGCELNFDTSFVEVKNDEAKMLKNMKIVKVFDEVDFVVSAAKLKTHAMMTYTGAIKNLYGTIPGVTKAEYHFKMNNIENFANAIVDICEYVKPDLSIIDGIEGMEGDGPSSGDKRFVGLIFASENPYALDTVASKIIGIDPLSIPILRAVKERNIFSVDINDIEFLGLKPQDIDIKQFKLPVSANVNFVGGRVPKFMENWILNNFRPRPVFDHNICVSCGICAQNCPPKAIDMSKGKPEVDLKRCIRCFCCHELCPKKAIDIKKHVIHERIFNRK
ncbi:DUF362 domain-containing protein [Sporanaerobacter acetigenes]|uniref:Uncharacterized conserved protein, DUF362 family n=1 Tax=Sporanaerobacter acetigenes DSM 13106 TaxID=1123281 RepID=A0A1M5WMW5_9FIRM|nr:DUF362 domain-containing protein [Sporanaerobacter acetigenes]SHH88935.1 Uncharacterized conserved protein, DUF362 family [Sporanaerobacter acetigenes DSM 13106]